ncbi:MAG: hypothetical protein HUU20_19150 [Pirellulales bacterium]|jgi:hypothetical protein|nr:hypothetical protein [Pirellulales bacterium]
MLIPIDWQVGKSPRQGNARIQLAAPQDATVSIPSIAADVEPLFLLLQARSASKCVNADSIRNNRTNRHW